MVQATVHTTGSVDRVEFVVLPDSHLRQELDLWVFEKVPMGQSMQADAFSGE